MCTYNGKAFLREQLDSIRAQTIRPDELIICDDASTDGTLEILSAFRNACNFSVKITSSKYNIGVSKNFEKAIAQCSCDVIVMADQDDIWLPRKIETVIRTLQDNPQCGYVFSNADLVDENGSPLGLDLWKVRGFSEKRFDSYSVCGNQVRVMLIGGNFIYGTTMAFRSEYKSVLLPIQSRSVYCTHDTWICLMLSALGAYGVAIPEALVQYRQHSKQFAGAGISGTSISFTESLKQRCASRSESNLALAEALEKIVEMLQLRELSTSNNQYGINQLTDKAAHLRARSLAESSRGLQKLKSIFRESITGRYGQYSKSYKSILRDLIAN